MPSDILKAVGLAAVALSGACQTSSQNEVPSETNAASADASPDAAQENVLLAEWTGPYGGVPAFDAMDLAALKPALEAGMAMQLEEIEAITSDPEPPTFENTIVALERTGRDLSRVFAYWGIWSANMSTPEFREVQQEMGPRLSEFSSKITQNEALFARVKAVYEGEEMRSLRPDQQRLVWLVYNSFAHYGATLDAEGKKRYAEINKRLVGAAHAVRQQRAGRRGRATWSTSPKDQLGGLCRSRTSKPPPAAATEPTTTKDE